MKKMNKLVALLLAAVMVLGMMPSVTAHAHENHTHAVEVNGIEEYPVIAADTPTTATFAEAGVWAYFTFTPEATDLYHYYSDATIDTYGYLYDADMALLTYNDDASWGNAAGVSSPNFCISYVLEAGTTYVLAARPYNSSWTGEFSVNLTTGHEYTSVVTKEHTCTEDGVLTYTCSYCGESYDEAIPAAHTWGDDGICVICDEAYLITGVCGDNLTWSLDWFGNMTISGTGDMYNYFYSWDGNSPSPWYETYNGNITALVIEEGCTSVGNYAFYQCTNMTSITLPASLTAIGSYAFQNTGLTALTLPETVASLDVGAFSSNYELTEVTLPSGLVTIPASCFASCGSLSKVVWPEAVTSIGDKAFYSCNLPSTVLPEGIAYIGQYAFTGNSNMSKLTLPSTLVELADYALAASSYYYSDTSDFVFTGNAPTIGANTFNYATANAWYPEGNSTWTEDKMQNYGGTLTWKAACAEHTYGEWTTVAATCTVGEYMTHTCTVCGWIENSPEGDPLGHDYIETVIEPDCANWQYGRTEITCSRCDYYEAKDYIAYEHDYQVTVFEVTCTTDGYTIYLCVNCGNYYTDNYIAAPGHSVETWSDPTEATCTEASVRTGTCTNCGETVSEELSPALGHTWDEENVVENADGSKTYTCTVCGDTYRTEGAYLYLGDNDFTIAGSSGGATKSYTAEESGTLTIDVSNMYYMNSWSGQWTTLAIDWAFRQGMFDIRVNDVAASYTIEGSEVNAHIITTTEVTAGDTITVTLTQSEGASYYYTNDVRVNVNLSMPVHEHSYTAVVTEATCTEYGYTTYVCECGDSYVDEDSWVEPEHSWDDGVVTEATCTEYGYTTFSCTACGESYVDEDSWTEPEHAWNDGIVTAPTCTEKGYTTFSCTACGESYVDEDSYTEATGHTYESVVTEPTCTEGGFTTHTCTVCGDTYTDAETEALGHSWKGTKCEKCDATRENPFTDVPEDSFYINPVLWAVEKGITTGATETLFDPNGVCMRGHVVTFLWRAMGKPEPTTTENPFVDVKETDYFYKAVLWAYETGVTTGIDATHFAPTGECNRAQVVTFLWRAMGKPEASATENPFSDVDVTDFYGTAVLWAVENGITNGMGDGTFGIVKPCNRAQVVTFLYRAMVE